jgi:anaerobic selenocysteine-containing dehydrogenase
LGSKHITYCRNCAATCGMILDVEPDGRIAGYETDREHPLSSGYMCIKGEMSIDLHNGAEGRLVECLKRDGSGELRPIDKNEAAAEIGDRLAEIIAAHGPRAVAMFFGTLSYLDSVGRPLARSLMSQIGSPNIFSTMTVDQSAKWVTASRMGAFASGRPTLDETDVAMIAGNNPIVSHQGFPGNPIPMMNLGARIREARRRGVRLIVVDPRRTETARHADLFIQPYPGHDAEIFAALIRLVLANRWHHEAFCRRWVKGLDELREAVAPFTPERVAASAGVEADQLTTAARWLGEAKKPCVGSGTGPDMGAFSNTAEHLSEALNAILGGYILPGEPIRSLGIFSPRSDTAMVAPPNRSWEREPKCHSADFGRLMGEFPSSLLPDEILTPGPHKIRALIVLGGNPAICLNDPDKTFAALRDLDLLVTIDPRMCATAKLAHYVIAPPLQFEREEATTFTDYCYPWPFAQYTAAAKPAPPQTLGEWELFWALGRRLGLPLTLKHAQFGMDYDAAPGGLALDMEVKPTREALIGWLADQTVVPFATLKAHPHGFLGPMPGTALKTPAEDDGVRLDICPPDVAAEIAQVAARPEPPPSEDEYLLSVRRIVETFNTMFQGARATQSRHGVNRLYVHPDDLARLGATADEAVEIRSRHGAIVGYARPDPSMKPGVVSMTHGWGGAPGADPLGLHGAHTGRLVSLDTDLQTINRMPKQTGVRVRLKPLGFDLEQASRMEPVGTAEEVG